MPVAIVKTAAYQIEKNVPLPAPNTLGATKYPWRDMEIGDSFVADKPVVNISAQAVESARRIGGGVKFSCRSIDATHTRIWRIA